MELITILNRCHHFRSFVYQHARLSADQKSSVLRNCSPAVSALRQIDPLPELNRT